MKKSNTFETKDNSSMKPTRESSYLDKLMLAQLEVAKQKLFPQSSKTK
ncbi:hypothetical protein [Flammeovirga sp. SJP92]|nr:hypothetical protein [Flammeovirga sp. SJP92]